ncbi:hypothetical protein LCM23_24595 [Cytobacillus kochii]|uniref:hypothetical protein n=1 Tax=Cytobacillus kochii TaxID=859143 RepID=UPI001CD6D153|nr:hypothetical protein [Cytobacillus kochii]MCA1029196.1 hypothetical protein [Cytobacillus kochii]
MRRTISYTGGGLIGIPVMLIPFEFNIIFPVMVFQLGLFLVIFFGLTMKKTVAQL